MNAHIVQLKGKKDSLLGRLRVLLSSELDLIKTLEMGGDEVLDHTASHGTGKESIELEGVLKNMDNDNTPLLGRWIRLHAVLLHTYVQLSPGLAEGSAAVFFLSAYSLSVVFPTPEICLKT